MITRSQSKRRNWLDLPRELMIQIFIKLGIINVIFTAQLVCSSWRDIAQDPQLYRHLDLRDTWNHRDHRFFPCQDWVASLIDKSPPGQLDEFSITYFCTNRILYKIMHRAPQLRCLRLRMCYWFRLDCLIEVLRKLTSLEEVEFYLCVLTDEVIKTVGQSCPKLKSFRLTHQGIWLQYPPPDANKEALAIAGNMNPGLERLHLIGNSMDNNGLEAILKRFPKLEYLDLRQCFHLDLKEDLLSKCKGIRMLRLPNDSTKDYEFDAAVAS